MSAVHPLLRRAFGALDAAGIAWAVLRGTDALVAPEGDVDLLLDAASLGAATVALRSAGFVRLPTAGRGTHAFFLGHAVEDGRWIKLDAVTELAYGPAFRLRTGLAAGCLTRRRRSDGLAVLAPDDAFWSLLLHAALDKPAIGAARRETLRSLAAAAGPDGPWGPVARAAFGRPPAELIASVRASDPAALDALTTAAHRRTAGAPSSARRARERATRAVERGRGALARPGLTVALIGQDGAGKSTVAAAMVAAWPFPSRVVYLGLWQRPGPAIGFVPGLDLSVRVLRAWRGWLVGRANRALRRLVVFDRYTFDALLADPARLPSKARLYRRVVGHACPPPDLVILLDAPGAVAFARKGEHDPDRLEADRGRFLELAAAIPGALVIDASRPFEAVRNDAVDAVWRATLARWAP